MTPERHERISELFHAALRLDPIEWADFLSRACAGDDQLRSEVESLLAFDKQTIELIVTAGVKDLTWIIDDPGRADEKLTKFCPKCRQQYPRADRFCTSDNQLLSLPDPYHLVGLTLAGKYMIEALVGVGGIGAVYAAHHIKIDRRVAFKILQPNVALGSRYIVGLFEQESRLVGRLHHNNIAYVTDAGQTAEGIAFMVMEWLEGHTLDEEIASSGRLSLEYTTGVIRQVAAALEEAHAKNIVHRDLKPSNIMLVDEPNGSSHVKVLDFGIAKVISTTAGSPVSTPIGTPHYASPEQLQEGGLIDKRSDIYSLGIILYQMLTGTLPFDDPLVQRVIQMQLTASPPSILDILPNVPASVDQLIGRMLAKDPSHRPQRAGEVAAILEEAIRSCPQPTVAELQAGAGPASERDSAVQDQASEKAPPPRDARWKYTVFVAALAVTVFLLIRHNLNRGETYLSPTPMIVNTPAFSPETPASSPALLQSLTVDLGNGVMIEMVHLPGGEFEMGWDQGEPDERPRHREKVASFAIGKYEVTQSQWKALMGSDNNPSYFKGDDDRPVETVSWNTVQDFIKRLRQKTGNEVYRLPTEIEWEYAALAGSTGRWGFGDDQSKLSDYAWYADNASNSTHPVGRKKPNHWGLFDMHGNVMEWCQDWYDEEAYRRKLKNDGQMRSSNSGYYVQRGGCIMCTSDACRTSYREFKMPDHGNKYIGFRIAIN